MLPFNSRYFFCLPIFFFIGIFFLCFPVGLIGEVTPTWAPSPQVLSTTDPIQDSTLLEIGPLKLQATRPILSLHTLPISLNMYTSALPDFIHWLGYQLAPSIELVVSIKLLSSILFLAFIWRYFTDILSYFWTMLYLLLLVSDWNFTFYKYALGNTEICLQLGWLCCTMALLQWQKGNDGSAWLGWGFGLGFLAKITFLLNLLPLLAGLLYVRPQKITSRKIIAPILLGSLPFILTCALFSSVEFPIRSHDFFTLQWERITQALTGANTSVREQHSNLWLWLFDPLPFFHQAYRVPNISMHWFVKAVGFTLGMGLIWRRRGNKSIRLLMLLCSLQVLVLGFIAKDLHHLVMATPLFWLFWITVWYHNSDLGWKLALAILPFFIGNIQILVSSPRIISQVSTPSFSAESQRELVELLQRHQVQQVVTMDYEIYGVLEALTSDIEITHGWGAISHERRSALPALLQQAKGGHLLVLTSSSGMIYNLQPTTVLLEQNARELGLQLVLENDSPENIWLYSIR